MKDWLQTILLFLLMMCAVVAFVSMLSGCGTTNHKRKLLQDMNPECEVSEDLYLVCPAPECC